MTFYRWNSKAQKRVEFPVRVYFREVVGTKKDGTVNERWTRADVQMHTKCTEAAGLREAFPEEFGGEPTAEEMEGQQAIQRQAAVTPEIIPAPIALTRFGQLPEGIRDNIERAFGILRFANGARLAKLNECFGGEDVNADDAAEGLLYWLRIKGDEQKLKKLRVERGAKNAKPTPPVQEPPPVAATTPAADPLQPESQPTDESDVQSF